MMKSRKNAMFTHTIVLTSILFLLGIGWTPVSAASSSKVGFLVVAPDRGFLGNEEIRSLVDEFKKAYPAALGLIGRDYTGVEGEYAELSLEEATRSLERMLIRRALTHSHGNKAEAARLLGIHRTALYAKLRQLGIEEVALP